MTEDWVQWESQVINGTFPLRRFLGRSSHSVVFLSDYEAGGITNAAIKLLPADPPSAQMQFQQWRLIATLSHPHLLRLFDSGRCQLGGHQFLFVVMEYAEETLAQILPSRALTPGELRELLRPTLDALTFLHGKELVQGQLKPANILVVDDQLKLASDTIRPAGGFAEGFARSSLYDPPEAEYGKASAGAADIWGLGVTIVESLTRSAPKWPADRSEPSLPPDFPPEFAAIVQRCLSRDPAGRPSLAELEAAFYPPPKSPEPAPVPTPAPAPVAPDSKPRSVLPMIGLALAAGVVVWGGARLVGHRPKAEDRSPTAATQTALAPNVTSSITPAQTAPDTTPSATPSRAASSAAPSAQSASSATPAAPATAASTPVAPARAAPTPAAPAPAIVDTTPVPTAAPVQTAPKGGSSGATSIVREEMPAVSRSARESIHGHFAVSVRVTVDASGTVVKDALVHPGPSKYFARVSSEAARKWRFARSAQSDRIWMLNFEFSRRGTIAHAEIQ